jgi:hypothetical protein
MMINYLVFLIKHESGHKKVRVKLFLCLISQALCHEDTWGSGGIAPPFLTPTLDGGECQLDVPAALPSTPLPTEQNLNFTSYIASAFTQVSCLAYSTMKMEAICSSETSVDFQRTTRRYIPEDSTLHIACIIQTNERNNYCSEGLHHVALLPILQEPFNLEVTP